MSPTFGYVILNIGSHQTLANLTLKK